jgi:hypothetical protein
MQKEVDFKFWGEDEEEDRLIMNSLLERTFKCLEKGEEPGCWDCL